MENTNLSEHHLSTHQIQHTKEPAEAVAALRQIADRIEAGCELVCFDHVAEECTVGSHNGWRQTRCDTSVITVVLR